jgi:small GTP-binding protein
MTIKKYLKIFIYGETFTGTSSIVFRFIYNIFNKKSLPTVGIDFQSINIDDSIFQIWITSGFFCSFSSSFNENCLYFVLVYDITNRKSFEKIKEYHYNAITKNKKIPTFFLVANKIDKQNIEVTTSEGKELAKKLNMFFFETSAFTGEGIFELFNFIKDFNHPDDKKEPEIQYPRNWFTSMCDLFCLGR